MPRCCIVFGSKWVLSVEIEREEGEKASRNRGREATKLDSCESRNYMNKVTYSIHMGRAVVMDRAHRHEKGVDATKNFRVVELED